MSVEYRKYFGKKFYKQKNGYWANMMPIHAHRWVWINHFGSIPNGMDIHHKDGDKDNNEIDNLQMLSRSDHLKEHWKCPIERAKRRIFLDKIRPQVHEWLRSTEGREKQKKDAIEGWKNRKKTTISCLFCSKQKITTQSWTKFCGENCEKKYRRRLGVDNIEVNCPICSKTYFKDKFSPKKFCSISCGAKNSAKEKGWKVKSN
jgi:hypothetical protein